jgi:hypothetical protein
MESSKKAKLPVIGVLLTVAGEIYEGMAVHYEPEESL